MKLKKKSWISRNVTAKSKSKIAGKGLFAKKPIKKGEKVIVWGGTLFTWSKIKSGKAKKHSIVEVGDNLFLAGKSGESYDRSDFLNHSCDPNLWLKDAVTLITRRNVNRGEELTADYATWVSRPNWSLRCHCSSDFCRRLITSKDWKLRSLQKRYRNHFSPYLNKRIRKLRSNK